MGMELFVVASVGAAVAAGGVMSMAVFLLIWRLLLNSGKDTPPSSRGEREGVSTIKSGLSLIVGGVSRLGGLAHGDLIDPSSLAVVVAISRAVATEMTRFTTTQTSSTGHEFVTLVFDQGGGVSVVVVVMEAVVGISVVVAVEVVDFGGEVVDGDVKGVKIHRRGVVFGNAYCRSFRKEDSMNHGGLGDGSIQGVSVAFGQGRGKEERKDSVYCELQTEGQDKRS